MKATATLTSCKCGFPTKITYRKPDAFTPTVGTFRCDGCKTKYQFWVTKTKVKNQVEVKTNLLEISDDLHLLLMEEEQARKEKPLEEPSL